MISTGFIYKSFNFPVGEKHIVIKDPQNIPSNVEILWEYENDAELMEIMLLSNALQSIGRRINKLEIPYVPYSRQDRINVYGECFSLQLFCKLINSLHCDIVEITDPHSDVTPALINNVQIIHQHEVFDGLLRNVGVHSLVSPDAGALKKIYKLAAITNPSSIIECTKNRNVSTGEIIEIQVRGSLLDKDLYIVDDICDGGRTFIEIAKILRSGNAKKIVLCVTHGFFTKGLGVFDSLIDEIYTRKGRIK